MTTIKISYDPRDRLFAIVESDLGEHRFRCAFLSASAELQCHIGQRAAASVLGALMDERVRSITLEV